MSNRTTSPSSLSIGLVVAGATTGALIAIGHRLGGVGLPFAATAAALLRRTATVGDPGLVTLGLGLHVVLMLAWSALFTWLVQSRRWSVGLAALLVVVLAHTFNWLVAWRTGNGLASVLPLGDRLVFAVVFASALTIGIRFAFRAKREAATFG